MRRCIHCGIKGDDASFYPNAPRRAWCRLCIDARRSEKTATDRRTAERIEREQVPIRAVVRGFQSDNAPMVYLLRANDRFKIGFSCNVDRRIRSLNTAYGISCRLVAVAPGNRSDELALHHRFAPYRISREWFSMRPTILKHFGGLPGALVFVTGYVTQEAPSSPSAIGGPVA